MFFSLRAVVHCESGNHVRKSWSDIRKKQSSWQVVKNCSAKLLFQECMLWVCMCTHLDTYVCVGLWWKVHFLQITVLRVWTTPGLHFTFCFGFLTLRGTRTTQSTSRGGWQGWWEMRIDDQPRFPPYSLQDWSFLLSFHFPGLKIILSLLFFPLNLLSFFFLLCRESCRYIAQNFKRVNSDFLI